jgi:hypothetical protein
VVVESATGTLFTQFDSVAGMNPGDVVVFAASEPERTEFATVASIAGTTVTWTRPLGRTHRKSVIANRVSQGALGPVKTVKFGAMAGDPTILMPNVTGLTAGNQVRIEAPGEPPSYHTISLLTAQTDAVGVFAIGPLGRAGAFTIRFAKGGLTPLTVIRNLSFDSPQDGGDFLI